MVEKECKERVERFKRYVESLENENMWIKSKTYPKHLEHEYIVKHKVDEDMYMFMAKTILDCGFKAKFYNKVYTYLIVGEYKYWVMTENINESIILNREEVFKNGKGQVKLNRYKDV